MMARWMRGALLALMLLLGSGAVAQPTQPEQPPALLAYACTFDRGANRLNVQAVLQSDVPGAVLGDYALSVTPAGSATPLAERAVSWARTTPRPPLQMIVLFDITDTVPVTESAQAVIDGLLPNLQPEDQVALITFDENVSLPTPFFTDKAALADQFLRGIGVGRGDNRVYNAMLAAVNAFPFAGQTRRVVVLVGDSGRRADPQAPESEVGATAQQLKTQIYPVVFALRDNPDLPALLDISEASRGYTFVYGERNEGEALGTARLTDDIVCPYQAPESAIRFVAPLPEAPITGAVEIGVIVETDLDPEATRVVFRVDDAVVQTSERLTYTFDAATVRPGVYTVRAELWDLQNNTLAQTPTVQRIVAQQRIGLGVGQGADANALRGAVEFLATTRSEFPLTQAVFTLALASDPANAQPFGQAAFRADGTAVLAFDDIQAAVRRVLPQAAAGDVLILGASVPGITAGDPPLAVADQPLRFAFSAPAATSPQPVPLSQLTPVERLVVVVVTRSRNLIAETLPYWLAAAAIIANLILVMMARRARIRRLILTPDKIDLSPQLMTLTVLRDGVRQSHTLTKKTLMLGRGASNDINLGDDLDISRQHGVVMWRRGAWWYTSRRAGLVATIEGRKRRGLYLQRLEPVTEVRVGGAIVLFHSNAQQDLSEFIKTDL
ncbi:MAG: hypothetical protein MUC99_04715 [Anaerolineae bacterium]|nr:hypothetical protein [Anaerolineae bacterium]